MPRVQTLGLVSNVSIYGPPSHVPWCAAVISPLSTRVSVGCSPSAASLVFPGQQIDTLGLIHRSHHCRCWSKPQPTMAGAAPDPEKQTHTATHPGHSTSTSPPALEKTPSTHRPSSTDTNPLSPLEHALGQPISRADIEPTPPDDDDDEDEDEDGSPNLAPLHLTRTRTSIASAASRPPDFEVTLDVDGPENPRNWYAILPILPPFSSPFLSFILSPLLLNLPTTRDACIHVTTTNKKTQRPPGPSGTAPTPSSPSPTPPGSSCSTAPVTRPASRASWPILASPAGPSPPWD